GMSGRRVVVFLWSAAIFVRRFGFSALVSPVSCGAEKQEEKPKRRTKIAALHRKNRRSPGGNPMRTLPYLAAFCLCFVSASDRPAAKPPAEVPKSLRVAAVQLRSTRDMDANVTAHAAWLKRCAADRVDVAVFPECSVSGYFDDVMPKLTAKALADA